MLRDRQHSEKDACERMPLDRRFPVLVQMVDCLDFESFVRDPAYRRRFSEVLEALSDEEFDRFESLYIRRLTLN